MEQQNTQNPSTAETRRNIVSRLFQSFSALVSRFFPNLSQKFPSISKAIAVIATAILVTLIWLFLQLSASSCGTTTKALVRNNQAKTTITITTTNSPDVSVSADSSGINPNVQWQK